MKGTRSLDCALLAAGVLLSSCGGGAATDDAAPGSDVADAAPGSDDAATADGGNGLLLGDGASSDASPGGGGCALATLGVGGKYSQDIFANWLDTNGTHAVTGLGDATLTPDALRPFKMIVAQDLTKNHAYTPAEAAALADWVRAGGGLMTMTGYVTGASDSLNVNRILVPYSLSYDAAFLLEAKSCTESCPPDRKTVSIDHWGTHPVTRGITEIGFDNGHAVVGSGSMIANEQGYQVLQVQDAGSGHVLMWGDEWITYDVEWTTNPQYQVQQFWQNIVDWLNPTGHCQAPAPPR